MTAWGLIAGVGYTEQQELTPGYLCDLFVLRRAYDDEQHGILREEDDHDIDSEDAKLFDRYDEIAEAEKKGRLGINAEGDQDNSGGGRRGGI